MNIKLIIYNDTLDRIEIQDSTSARQHFDPKKLKLFIVDRDYDSLQVLNHDKLQNYIGDYAVMYSITKKKRPKYTGMVNILYDLAKSNNNYITNINSIFLIVVRIINILSERIHEPDNAECVKPVLKYTQSQLHICPPDSECCAICYEGDTTCPKFMLPCNHAFHVGCLTPWINSNNTCPVCRAEINMPMTKSYARDLIGRNLTRWIRSRRTTKTNVIKIKKYSYREINRIHRHSYADTDRNLRRYSAGKYYNMKRLNGSKRFVKKIITRGNCQPRTLRY